MAMSETRCHVALSRWPKSRSLILAGFVVGAVIAPSLTSAASETKNANSPADASITASASREVVLASAGSAARAPASYNALVEPAGSDALDLNDLQSHYTLDPSDKHAAALIDGYILSGDMAAAWSRAEDHAAQDADSFFAVQLRAVSAGLRDAARLKKLDWAVQYRGLCEAAFARNTIFAPALECLIKFHTRAPALAGGIKARVGEYLPQLRAISPGKADLLEAELSFKRDQAHARVLVDRAMQDPDMTDAGLLQAAMVYGYFDDWPAVRGALARITDASPIAAMRDYQLGRLCAQQERHPDMGEQALLRFLSGNAVRDGVDYRGAAHWRLGQIFAQTQRYDLAEKALDRALALNPDLKDARRDLKIVRTMRK